MKKVDKNQKIKQFGGALLIIIFLSGLYISWQLYTERLYSNNQPVAVDDDLGSYTNPITSLSGKTYTLSIAEIPISLELPIEFKDSALYESSRWISKYINGPTIENYAPVYSFDLMLANREDLIPSNDSRYEFERTVYPNIKDLQDGSSYTAHAITDEQRTEIFGTNLSGFDEKIGDSVYTKIVTINGWKVYEVIHYIYGEPIFGQIATREKNDNFLTISIRTTYNYTLSDQSIEELLHAKDDLFYKILNSAN